MQMKVITLAIPALAMAAFAQTDPSQGRQPESRTESQTESQSSTTMQEEQRPVRSSRTGQEMGKMRTWKGTLVDASCAQNMAGMGTSSQTTTSAERSATESTTGEKRSEQGEASREQHQSQTGAERSHTSATAGGMHVDAKAISQSCPVTSTTKDFALVTNDGRFLQLNDEGDAKVASELKTNNKWNKAINSNKKISASVRGNLEGDTLQVESVK